MNTENTKDYVIVLGPNTGGVNGLLTELRRQDTITLMEVGGLEEAIQMLHQCMPCVLIASINGNQGVSTVVTLLKRMEHGIKHGQIKSLIVSKIKSTKIASMIIGLGVTDYMEEPIPARTLLFKANIQIKALEVIRKREENKKNSTEKVFLKKEEENKHKDPTGHSELPRASMQAPLALTLGDDIFLFKDCIPKKLGGKILFEMDGPPQEAGDWVQQEAEVDGEKTWRWTEKNETGSFIVTSADKAQWVHVGHQPQFNTATGKWRFMAKKPDLSIFKKNKKIGSKVSVNASGNLEVAADSKAQADTPTPMSLEKEKSITENPATQEEEKKKLLLEIQKELHAPADEKFSEEEFQKAAKKYGLNPLTITKKELATKRRLEKLEQLKNKLRKLNTANPIIQEKESRSEAAPSKVIYFYKRPEELKSINASWEKTGKHYAFLSSNIHYGGFHSIDSIFPLWIYAGPEAPEFFSTENHWRFSGQDAQCMQSSSDLPFEVLDYLNAINNQVKQNNIIAEAKEKVAALDQLNKEKEEAALTERKKIQAAAAEKLARLEAQATAEPNSSTKNKKEEEKKSLLEMMDAIKKKLEEAKAQYPPEQTEPMNAAENLDESTSLSKNSRKYNIALIEKLEKLKSRLEQFEPVSEKELQDALEEPTPVAALTEKTNATSNLLDRLAKQSPGIEKFIAKRKEKNPAPEKTDPPKYAGTLKEFLGLSIAISDAIYEGKPLPAIANKLSYLIAQSISDCFVLLTEKQTDDEHIVWGCSSKLYAPNAKFRESSLDPNRIQNIIYHELNINHSDGEKNLGFLILEPCAPRTSFTTMEIESLKKVAELLANYWSNFKKSKQSESNKEEKAA